MHRSQGLDDSCVKLSLPPLQKITIGVGCLIVSYSAIAAIGVPSELHRPADEVEVRGPQGCQKDGSGSAGPPAPSSDEEYT